MYNRVILMGRLTKDPELKQTQSGLAMCSFTIAVDRKYAKQDADVKADFFYITSWNKTAEFVAKYFAKGTPILVEGRLQNDEYKDKDGTNHRKTAIIADSVSFTGSKRENGGGHNTQTGDGFEQSSMDLSGFEDIISDGDVPF